MNEAKRLIAKMIDSGEYFRDAKEWYAAKYLYPYTQRIYIGIIAGILIVFTTVIFKTALIDNTKERYPFPIYAEDEVKYFFKIKPISAGAEPVAISVARYFASIYVESREQYDFKIINDKENWKEMLRKVRELSSRKVFSDYVDYIDTSTNPDSPIIRYKDFTKRKIEIQKVEFPKISNNPASAKIYYKAIEITSNDEKVSFWVADLNFSMSEIDKIIDDKSGVEFTITKYTTSQLKLNN